VKKVNGFFKDKSVIDKDEIIRAVSFISKNLFKRYFPDCSIVSILLSEFMDDFSLYRYFTQIVSPGIYVYKKK
jgi:hypothetical protein